MHVNICLPMFTRLYLCSHLFTNVYPCLLVFTYVYSCLPYLNVHVSLFTHVYSCLAMFTLVHLCYVVFTYVYQCLLVFICLILSTKRGLMPSIPTAFEPSRVDRIWNTLSSVLEMQEIWSWLVEVNVWLEELKELWVKTEEKILLNRFAFAEVSEAHWELRHQRRKLLNCHLTKVSKHMGQVRLRLSH